MTGVTTIEDSPCMYSFRPADHEKTRICYNPGFGNLQLFRLLTSDCQGQIYLVMLQFYVATEAFNTDFGTTLTHNVLQMTTRSVLGTDH